MPGRTTTSTRCVGRGSTSTKTRGWLRSFGDEETTCSVTASERGLQRGDVQFLNENICFIINICSHCMCVRAMSLGLFVPCCFCVSFSKKEGQWNHRGVVGASYVQSLSFCSLCSSPARSNGGTR